MKEFWNERYSAQRHVYGEGRNAVYAAQCGWRVDAFDQSEHGKTDVIRIFAIKQ